MIRGLTSLGTEQKLQDGLAATKHAKIQKLPRRRSKRTTEPGVKPDAELLKLSAKPDKDGKRKSVSEIEKSLFHRLKLGEGGSLTTEVSHVSTVMIP